MKYLSFIFSMIAGLIIAWFISAIYVSPYIDDWFVIQSSDELDRYWFICFLFISAVCMIISGFIGHFIYKKISSEKV